jgi:hypothetical protein
MFEITLMVPFVWFYSLLIGLAVAAGIASVGAMIWAAIV